MFLVTLVSLVPPYGLRLRPRMLCLFLLILLALVFLPQDRLIIATAIPQISNDFSSACDIGWYGTAYMLTNCAFQLLFGKLYGLFRIKRTFLVSIVLFEIGSSICGAEYRWNSVRVVALLVLTGVLLLDFVALQIWRPEQQVTVAPHILSQRSNAARLPGFVLYGRPHDNIL